MTTFDTTTALRILREDDLSGPVVSVELPGSGPLNAADDLTVGPDGTSTSPTTAAAKWCGSIPRRGGELRPRVRAAAGVVGAVRRRAGLGSGRALRHQLHREDLQTRTVVTDMERMTAWVHGFVQGVGFRWWTRARALELGLVGYAANQKDGRVLVIAEGASREAGDPPDAAAVGRHAGRGGSRRGAMGSRPRRPHRVRGTVNRR